MTYTYEGPLGGPLSYADQGPVAGPMTSIDPGLLDSPSGHGTPRLIHVLAAFSKLATASYGTCTSERYIARRMWRINWPRKMLDVAWLPGDPGIYCQSGKLANPWLVLIFWWVMLHTHDITLRIP